MQRSEIKQVFETYDSSANARTEYEHDVKKCNLEIWQQLLKNVSTEKAKKIFNEHDREITSYQSLGYALKDEMEKDKLFRANYYGFQTIAQYEKFGEEVLTEIRQLQVKLGERYAEEI